MIEESGSDEPVDMLDADAPPPEPLAPERKDRMARRLAWMLAVGVGTPFLCVVLIANALMPCLHAATCKTKRGELLAALAVFLTVAMGLLARRAMRAALDRADNQPDSAA